MATITYGGGGTVTTESLDAYDFATYTNGDPIGEPELTKYVRLSSTFELQSPGTGNEGKVIIVRNHNTLAITFTVAGGISLQGGTAIPAKSTAMFVVINDTTYDASGTV